MALRKRQRNEYPSTISNFNVTNEDNPSHLIDENIFCLYFHINPIKQEIFYIGIGNAKRPYDFKQRSKTWHYTVNKYGYDVIVIHKDLSWEDVCKLEKQYIKQIGRRDLRLGSLVNHTDGGDGIINLSAAIRKKMSLKKLGSIPWNKGMIGIGTGRKKTEAEKLKISQSKPKLKILQIDKLTEKVIKEWESQSLASKTLDIEATLIANCCKGRIISAGGYLWKYKDKNLAKKFKKKVYTSYNAKPILQFSLDEKLIREFNSTKEAKKIFKGDIKACLKNKQQTAGGFIWRYKI